MIEFLGTHDDFGVALDDFSFNSPQSVAEPASMILLATGLASLVARHRRRLNVLTR